MRAMAFDVFGTLLDVEALTDRVRRLVNGAEEFVALWRAKQLEYTFLLSLMERFLPFTEVTRRALRYADRRLDAGLSGAELEELMAAWVELPPYEEVPGALAILKEKYELVVLSNGEARLVEAALENAGLGQLFARVLSAEDVRIYKPSPKVYGLACDRLGLSPGEVGLVSSNPFDVMGAKAAGLRVIWVNRRQMPMDPLGLTVDLEVADFGEVVRRVGELQGGC